jgi:hypothetical protein
MTRVVVIDGDWITLAGEDIFVVTAISAESGALQRSAPWYDYRLSSPAALS